MTSTTGDYPAQKVELNNVTGFQLLGNDYYITSKDKPGIILRISTYTGRGNHDDFQFQSVALLMISTFKFTQ